MRDWKRSGQNLIFRALHPSAEYSPVDDNWHSSTIQGPDEDQENELTPEDLTALREKRKAQLEEKLRQKSQAKLEEEGRSGAGDEGGCSWGMGMSR